jgi:hypothetical protein
MRRWGATRRLSNKKNNNRTKGRKGKDEPGTLDPSVYRTMVFLSDVEPEIIISRVAHKFGRAGGFYFRKKQLQCKETMTPFIIFFLYTFNDITTLRGKLSSLLEEALQGMKDDFALPDEFGHAPLPDSTFVTASQNSQDNPEAVFATTRVICKRHDGRI